MLLFTPSCHTITFFYFNGLFSSNRGRFLPWFSELLLRNKPGMAVARLSYCFFSTSVEGADAVEQGAS